MSWFQSFRDGNSNTNYGHDRHPVEFDKEILIIVYLFVTSLIAFVVLILGSRGREKWTTLARLALSLHSGVILIVSLFGSGWQNSKVSISTWYSFNCPSKIHGDLEINIGLKTFNVTLKGDLVINGTKSKVNYNEEFIIDKVSDMSREYEEGLVRGLPWPILTVVEYFTVDGGGLIWMRGVHEAGHIAYILLWSSFVLWAAGVVLLSFVVSRGCLLWTLSGALMIISCIVYDTMQTRSPINIHFHDSIMSLQYGWSFWLVLISGIASLLTGIILFILHYKYPVFWDYMLLIDTTDLSDEHMEEGADDSGPLLLPTPFMNRRRSSLPASYISADFNAFQKPSKNPAAYRRSASVCEGMSNVTSFTDTTHTTESETDDEPAKPELKHSASDDMMLNTKHGFINLAMTSIAEEDECFPPSRRSSSAAGLRSSSAGILHRGSDFSDPSRRSSNMSKRSSNVSFVELPAITRVNVY